MVSEHLVVRPKTNYEKIEESEASNIWKAFMRIMVSLSNLCKLVISSAVFETFILLVILCNVGTLAAEDPKTNEQSETLEIF